MVIRLYLPYHVLEKERYSEHPGCYLIGWNNGDSDLVVVASIYTADGKYIADALSDQNLLKELPRSSSALFQTCGQKHLSIVGSLNLDPPYPASKNCLFGNLSDDNMFPSFDGNVQVIMVEAPSLSRLQYLSISPISLELSELTDHTVIAEQYESKLVKKKEQQDQFQELLKQHSVRDCSVSTSQLPKVIAQINTCLDLGKVIEEHLPKLAVAPPSPPPSRQNHHQRQGRGPNRRKRQVSVSHKTMASVEKIQARVVQETRYVWSPLLKCVIFLGVRAIFFLCIWAEIVLNLIEWKLFGSYPIRDFSAVVQQFDLRLQQFRYLPLQYTKITVDNWPNLHANVEYIRFYNTIWLVINDCLLGLVLSGFVEDNKDLIAKLFAYGIDEALNSKLSALIGWLMNWPAGLKLNTELASFFGELLVWVINCWSGFLAVVFKPHTHFFFLVLKYSGFLGATLTISVVVDLLAITTLHVYWFYVASARIYHWHLGVVTSLFHVMRGKKLNVLRKRVDSSNYEFDQLLMATILFTVALFLLPTVVVFYLTFALARLAIVLFTAGLETVLSFLNHFPLFAIMLRVKDYQRIPGGICFEPQPEGIVILKPIPLPVSKMFHQYLILSDRMKMHYLSPTVIKVLLTGQFVPIKRTRLYGLLYSMLPEKRLPLNELAEILGIV